MLLNRHKTLLVWLLCALVCAAGWGGVAEGVLSSELSGSCDGKRLSLASQPSDQVRAGASATAAVNDTVPRQKPQRTVLEDLNEPERGGYDLKTPENLSSEGVYDEESGMYKVGTHFTGGQSTSSASQKGSKTFHPSGDGFLGVPYWLTREEYMAWTLRRTLGAYYRKKNADEYKEAGKDKFDFTDMQFSLGPADKVFGPGGVRIKTQGSAELKLGANMRFTDNPSLSERNRKVFGFDFDEKINISVSGKVGDKMGMDFNYNSDATFNFDTQKLKLAYQGKEDEIIQLVEAGNVSMPTQGTLIKGATSLFGMRTDLQFGKLKVSAVVAQKKSASSTVSSKGGVQLSSYEFSADAYDENRHFFLAHFFRDRYNESMAQLPTILSGVSINRIEVWVTNKTGATTNTRSLIAFTDLGEQSHFTSTLWGAGGDVNPSNASNTLYSAVNSLLPDARDVSTATAALDGYGLVGGTDYEKLENARLLSSSEYTLNSALGYLSLKSTLQTDQVLAVAFEYTYRGQTYQVGEFSTDRKTNTEVLFVKTLKNTACTPRMGNWDLMMKNVYALGATSVQKDKFRLDIKILSDTSGVYLSYIPEPDMKDKKILSLVGLDRLDNNNKRNPNGYFDYVEGYTIDASSGRVFFPVVEPFGKDLRACFASDDVADRYVFQELYDSTRTVARQMAEKNKYQITGEYKASRQDEISLGTTNVPRGSVVVTAGGQTLTEGSDYTVDYNSGIVKILNKSILDAGTNVSVSLESDTHYGMQRKTLVGLGLEYAFSKDFTVGASVMHLGEKPLTTKVAMGQEALNNTLWGFNLSWKKQSQRLTDWLDRLPLLHLTAPSSISVSGEVAQLIAGKNRGSQGNASYIDDFENTKSEIEISSPTEWQLSSVPSTFQESQYAADVRSGYNRALLAWYKIDPLFTRRSSSLTPGHIKGDLAQLSLPEVREVYTSELFPNKSINMQESNTLSMLNLAYYPNERGPYNLDPDIDQDGRLNHPEKRWGGMMRRLETSDFETANIEYIEFWMMDPFISSERNGTTAPRGQLYFNLGEVSEDILKDGKKFYESGMPVDDDPAQYSETCWGRVPVQNSVTYAFNTSSGSRQKQDVGLNGLSSEQERTFGAYADYLTAVQGKVRPEVYDSIYQSPSADKYHYFRGSDYDAAKRSILERYKYINNPNGNSVDSDHSPESYSTAYKTTPDVEDINQDFTLNEYEKYFEYRVEIAPESFQVGQNYIVDRRVASGVKTRDGNVQDVTWYLFRIPVDQYERREGGIADFSSIRFMRLYMTGFSEPVVLRLGTFHLVHGEWRAYEQALYTGKAPDATGTLEVSAVNFEENNEKEPVNYILPPGISRIQDPSQGQILQNDEQSLCLTVKNLASGDARAVYKNTTLDLRRYRHLQMFAHANSLLGEKEVEDGQVSFFIRLGSDYKSNFYEYEIPLKITPPNSSYHNSDADARIVWPVDNMVDIDLSVFTDLKRERNKAKSLGLTSYAQLFSQYDSDRPANKISVMGNPSLGEVRTIMLGVRNNSREVQYIEVWANELRLQEFTNQGGWGARAQVNLQLSDLATVNFTGHLETAGFGGIEESVSQRRDDNLYEFTVTTNIDAGKIFPEKAKVVAPIYYSYSKQRTSPQYNPLDTDMTMDDALAGLTTKAEKDSLKNIAEKVVVSRNLSISGARINIVSKPYAMPYDPANFTFGYARSLRRTTGETTAWERDEDWKYDFAYSYSPNVKGWQPWGKKSSSKGKTVANPGKTGIAAKSGPANKESTRSLPTDKKKKSNKSADWKKILTEFQLNFLPQSIGFNSNITRSYYELQERDMENLENTSLPLTWSSDFLWNRTFQLKWDLTKNIHTSFSSGTNAEIEQPYTALNKDLYPDAYSAWKDSVWHSILHFGRPLSYSQQFDFSWKLPLNKIPIFDWLTTDVTYSATYNYARGADLDDGTSMGGTVSSSRNIGGNGRINFETLYNHVPFLKTVNKKYATSSNSKKTTAQPKNFEKEITLKADTTTSVQHNQRSKKLRVVAIRQDGTRYPVRYKVVDNNNLVILTQDTAKVKLTVSARKRKEDMGWYKALQFTSRFLMMVRSANISYTNKFNMSVPGFLPEIGDFYGQTRRGGLAPGLDFAFGFTDESYVRRAAERGWLLCSDSIITPATTNLAETYTLKATLEPIRDLKIDLTATRSTTRARSIQYMYQGMPFTETGSFNQTTISIKTAFEKTGSADKGYPSKAFNKFVSLLDVYRDRVEARYAHAVYPAGSEYAGEEFSPEIGAVDKYSADVMIPAFLKAYTSGASGLDIFPSIAKMLPNWTVSYAGLAKLPRMKRIFKSFNLNHAYKSVFAVGSYSTYTAWQSYLGGLGFINDVATGAPTPSGMYDISTVSINESFTPLFGIDMTFLNNITAKVEYRKTRVLTLSMTSQQITETRSNDLVIGTGYKIADFKLFTPKKAVRTKGGKKKPAAADEDGSNSTSKSSGKAPTGFAHDLNLRLDLTFRNQAALSRNILTMLSQATSGNRAVQVSFSADYSLSKYLTLSAYYDRQMNKPLLTSSSYPVTTQDFGLSLKFILNR